MSKRKPAWDILPDKQKQKCINNIIAFFQDERDETIGVLAAEQIFDVIMGSSFADAYNKGVLDAQKLMQEKIADMNIDLDALFKKNDS